MTTSIFDEIKRLAKIKIVIEHYLSLTKKGKNYWSVCPFHSDSSPSLSVSEEKNIFKCFSCNSSGDAISFVMKYTNVVFIEAAKKVAELCGIECNFYNNKNFKEINKKEVFFKINETIAKAYSQILFADKNKQELKNLIDKRFLSIETIKEFSLGIATKENIVEPIINKLILLMPESNVSLFEAEELGLIKKDKNEKYHDFYRDRIIFPIFNSQKKIIGFSGRTINDGEQIKYLNSSESSIFKKQESFFNIQNVVAEKPIYIFEGFFDLLSSHQLGFKNSIALMCLFASERNINNLKGLSNQLILVLDNDNAGKKNTCKLAQIAIINGFNVKVVNLLNENIKDIDELIRLNKEHAISLLEKPIDFFDWFKLFILYESKEKNIELDFSQINKYVDFLLNWIFKNVDGNFQIIKKISYDIIKIVIDGSHTLYSLLKDNDLKDQINEKKNYLLLLGKQKTISTSINKSVKNTIKKENKNNIDEESDLLSKIIIYWFIAQQEIRDKFPNSEWLFNLSKKESIYDDVKKVFDALDEIINLNKTTTSEQAKNLLIKYSQEKYINYLHLGIRKKDDINNFFNAYYCLIQRTWIQKKEQIASQISSSWHERLHEKREIEKKIGEIKDCASKTFKKLIPFMKN